MFIEERLEQIGGYGSGGEDEYSVSVHETGNGYEYFYQRHPYVRAEIELIFNNRLQSEMINIIRDLFNRAGGNLEGFRVKNYLDYSTNAYSGTPTYSDQECVAVTDTSESPNVVKYQLYRWYGTYGQAGAARRRIRKPVSGTVLAGFRNTSVSPITEMQAIGGWSVDSTTGLITFNDITLPVSNITQASQAVVTVGGGHGLVADDTVYFSDISGMTEINNLRAAIVSVDTSTITVDVNSSAFSAFASSSPLGSVRTAPQPGEIVLAGCEFDLPVRFSDPGQAARITSRGSEAILNSNLTLIEILNP